MKNIKKVNLPPDIVWHSTPLAEGGSQTVPAFIARPAAAPIYHGFEVLRDVVVGGFTPLLGRYWLWASAWCGTSEFPRTSSAA